MNQLITPETVIPEYFIITKTIIMRIINSINPPSLFFIFSVIQIYFNTNYKAMANCKRAKVSCFPKISEIINGSGDLSNPDKAYRTG